MEERFYDPSLSLRHSSRGPETLHT